MTLGEEVREKAAALGIEVPVEADTLFERHAAMVDEWNQRLNLTRIPKEEAAEKHFLDSLTVLAITEVVRARRLIDVGSGAGFPGIPLKIAKPGLQVTLVDSLGKRVKFLENVIQALDLRGISCYHARAEDIGRDQRHREQYDVALARAVAHLAVLCEYLLPLVRLGGVMVAMKGPTGKSEVEEAQTALKELGGQLQDVMETQLPSGDVRQLIVVSKVKPTSMEYPRRPGMPQKRPL
jgi:16S rRNA (guanine527-N7)-methyltransferase